MSILNAWLTSDGAALVGVDTDSVLTSEGGEVHRPCSKMIPLVHANCVIAGRGSLPVLSSVFGALNLGGFSNFDEIKVKLPEVLNGVFQGLSKFYPGTQGFQQVQSCVVVGQSKSGIIEGVRYRQDTTEAGFIQQPDLFTIGPTHSKIDIDKPLSWFEGKDAGQMARLAIAQTKMMHRVAPGAAAGGEFVVARVSRDGISIARICSLPDPPPSLAAAP